MGRELAVFVAIIVTVVAFFSGAATERILDHGSYEAMQAHYDLLIEKKDTTVDNALTVARIKFSTNHNIQWKRLVFANDDGDVVGETITWFVNEKGDSNGN
jgi:hypothetical protein